MTNWDGVFATDERQACIFPNPSTEDITVTCEGMHQIEVFSMEGRLVKSIQTASPVHQLNGLMNGTYLVKITTEKGVIVKKAVKL